jgi:hypothetical protein
MKFSLFALFLNSGLQLFDLFLVDLQSNLVEVGLSDWGDAPGVNALLFGLIVLLGLLLALFVGSHDPLDLFEFSQAVPDDFSCTIGVVLSAAAVVPLSPVNVPVSPDSDAGPQVNLPGQSGCSKPYCSPRQTRKT